MATMIPPSVVLVIQDQRVLELRFRLTERALTRVKPGDTVRATFGAIDLTREARVLRISPTVDVRSRTIEVVTELDNEDGALRPGLLADVELGALVPNAKANAGGAP
jgi:multidrug efflux pump subunit AcrA (membrane-fusion protein)